jgi:hypothetical protein
MDESDRQINFNGFKKSATSLLTVIVIMNESDHQIDFNSLKKSVTLLSAAGSEIVDFLRLLKLI